MLGTDQVLNQGRYRIISSFGQDGSGGMYEAYDTVSETNVVLRESVGIVGKVATANKLDAVNAAFADEAKKLAEIRHESVVSVQDYFSELDRQYLVLESVTGYSLTKYFEPGEAKPALTDVLSWAEQVLGALQYLHRLSPPVTHGEIRPENIKLTSGAKVKLLTTKISERLGSGAVREARGQAKDTAFNYRPLEQIWPDISFAMQKVILEGFDEKAAGVLLRPLDARSDIYSVGASFYHVLTGTPPIDVLERSTAILDGKPDPLPRPTDLDASIPPEISDALMRAMSIRRENRFDWAVIMSQVLRTAVIRAKERESELAQIPKEEPNTAKEKPVDKIPMRSEREPEPDFDHTSPEAHFELRRQLVEDRQIELEAEQAQLDEERNKIEQRRLELEAEKERHAGERERLRVEAEEARQRAEMERRRLEKERLEQEAEKERKKIAEKLAALDAERERERAEEERLQKEAEADRQRAEQRLNELRAEQERHRAEQERIALEAKRELDLAEKRLLELSGADLDLTEPEVVEPVEPSEPPGAREVKAFADAVIFSPTFDYESMSPDRSGFNWHVPVAGGVALLIVGGVLGWMFMPSDGPAPAAYVQPAAIVKEETKLPTVESSPLPETEKVASQPETEPVPASVESEAAAPATEAQKHPQISAVQEKQKRPAAEKAPAAKKKVTVDDLINDN